MSLFPDPEDAREALARELARPEYRESLLDRAARWLRELLDGVRDATEDVGGLSPALAVLLLVALVGLVAFALSRLRRNPAPSRPDRPLFEDAREAAATHRRNVQRALAAGDWDTVVVEATRQVAADLFERGLVPEQRDVTVHEIAVRGGQVLPGHRDRLADLAGSFDRVRYGDRRADRARATSAAALADEVAGTTPADVAERPPVPAVPR
jgi:hypothetical protein